MSGDDLVRWLRAQLDEDERIARDSIVQATVHLAGAAESSVSVWRVIERPATGTFVATSDQWDRVAEVVPTYGGAHAEHIASHDPARVLREIDAKRQLLAEYEQAGAVPDTREPGWQGGLGYVRGLALTVRLMALPYADRPGYREAVG